MTRISDFKWDDAQSDLFSPKLFRCSNRNNIYLGMMKIAIFEY